MTISRDRPRSPRRETLRPACLYFPNGAGAPQRGGPRRRQTE